MSGFTGTPRYLEPPRNGRIYEYVVDDGHRILITQPRELVFSYPNGANGASCYQVGSFLRTEMSLPQAASVYEEFGPAVSGIPGWGALLMNFFRQDRVTVYMKILSITGTGEHGFIQWQPICAFRDPDDSDIRITSPLTFRNDQFNGELFSTFRNRAWVPNSINRVTRQYVQWQEYLLQAQLLILTGGIGTGVRAAATGAVRPLITRIVARMAQEVLRGTIRRMVNSFAQKLASKAAEEYRRGIDRTLRTSSGGASASPRTQQPEFDIDRVIHAAGQEAIAEGVSNALVGGITSKLPQVEVVRNGGPGIVNSVLNYGLQRFTSALLLPCKAVVSDSIMALGATRNSEQFAARLLSRLNVQGADLERAAVGEVLSALEQVVSQPQRIRP